MLKDSYRLILALSVLILILIVASGLLLRDPFKKPETTIDLSRPSVIKDIQELGRLETASYTVEKIIEAGQDGNIFQDILYGDRILLIAHGQVIAGIDLTSVTEKDVVVNGETLSITLPPPQIFSSRLDNQKTTVYDRSQGILNQADKDLETEARQAGESAIYEAACEAGILEDARENAIERITQLFTFAGFSHVTVTAPEGNC